MDNFSSHDWEPIRTHSLPASELFELPLQVIPFETNEIDGTIPLRFSRVVAAFPQKLAVKWKDRSLTYQELDQASDRVAKALLASIGEDRRPVALLLAHNLNAIIAILGVLKAGKCYVALDAASPNARTEAILVNAQPGVIVFDNDYHSRARQYITGGIDLLDLDEIRAGSLNLLSGVDTSPDSLAAIFYTSGSTGEPKGVGRTHRQILHYVWSNTQIYGVNPMDRQALLSFLGFAGSTSDIFQALLSGAGLYLFSPREGSLDELVAWLWEEQITLFHPPVELFRQLSQRMAGSEELFALRLVVLASQTLYKQDIEDFYHAFPADCVVVNRYGLTEVGAAAQYPIRRDTILDGEVVPVGYPVHDMEIYLVDETGEIVERGQIGEIMIRSRYLAPGYLKDEELTRQVFLPDPEGGSRRVYRTGDLGRWRDDGCLEHLGRKDDRVKIRGFRVELAAVEAALLELEQVRQAVVVAQRLKSGENRLVAYLVLSERTDLTAGEVRSRLVARLPDYMIPSAIIVLENIPVTASGKVDRRALPVPGSARPELQTAYQPPRTDLETQLSAIWEEILGIDAIGVQDNFFELGGSSLHAIRILARIADHFGVSLSQNHLFANPTIAGLAALVIERFESSDDQELDRLLSLVEGMSEQEAEKLLFEIGPENNNPKSACE